MKKHKITFLILICIYGASLLVWPIMSFGVIFLFDAPGSGTPLNYFLAYSTWFYPVLVIAGSIWGHYKRNSSIMAIIIKTSLPLLSGMWIMMGVLGWELISDALVVTEYEKASAEIERQLDPIYQKRLDAINERDPVQDARQAIKRNELAFLPSGISPVQGSYDGLEDSACQDVIDAVKNYQVILNSEYLKSLHDLVFDDSHELDKEGIYMSNVHNGYFTATWSYKREFNKEICNYLIESNKPLN